MHCSHGWPSAGATAAAGAWSEAATGERFALTHFQWLAALFVELYLQRLGAPGGRQALADELNARIDCEDLALRLNFERPGDRGNFKNPQTAKSHSATLSIFRGDDESASAQGHFVHVYVDRATNRPAPIPDTARNLLATLMRGAAG